MRYYFLGIAGTAMASLAALLKQKGHEVWGSDQGIYPPMSDFLAEQASRCGAATRRSIWNSPSTGW